MAFTMKAIKNLNAALLPDFEKRSEFNFNKVIEDTDHSIIYSSELGLFRYDEKTKKTNYLGQEGAMGEFAPVGDTLIISVWGPTALNPNYKASRLEYDNSVYFPPTLFFQFVKDGEPKNVTRLVKYGKRLWYTTSASGLWMSKGMNLVNFNQTDSTISNNLNDICFDGWHVIFGSNIGEICIATYANNKLKIDYRINSDNGVNIYFAFLLRVCPFNYLFVFHFSGSNKLTNFLTFLVG
jgi:hypothetical protein